ncbi:hypothetical protein LC040_03175 [Bacillus tianshenii]|nr:hypothetical protein LC040_03175 [Bacillus tianshenii]
MIHCTRQIGLLNVSKTYDFNDFEVNVKEVVQEGFVLIVDGREPSKVSMFLELRKMELIKNPSLTADDLKLNQLCIESIPYVQSGDIEEFQALANFFLEVEGNPEHKQLLSKLFYLLQKAEVEKREMNKQEFKRLVEEIDKEPIMPRLSEQEIEQILRKAKSKG